MPPKKKTDIEVDNTVTNFYEKHELQEMMKKHPNPGFNQHRLPLPFYGIIAAQSGAGKSNLLLNIIRKSDNTYSHIYILNQMHEEIYDYLQKKIPNGLTVTQKIGDMPDFDELEKSKDKPKLIVFDDMNNVKSAEAYINTMYKRGRKCSCSVLYLAQSYFATPIFVRKNTQFLFLLSISGKKDLNLILQTFNDVEPEQLMKMYKNSTKKHLDFFKIHTTQRDLNLKYSHNFTGFFNISEVESDDDDT
jgi:hypothetical protein